MERIRKPFQGVINIVRFNWHFYVLSVGFILLISILNNYFQFPYSIYINILALLITFVIFISLSVSFYVYDLSNLYTLNWLNNMNINSSQNIININAGFDETSNLLHTKFPLSELKVFDFYDPEKHTEISIKRARNAYPLYENTKQINTTKLLLPDNYADNIFLIFAAHEIRNDNERVVFFKEINRVIKDAGKIIVTEHLRNLPNFLAYNIGFFHFFSKSSWYKTFINADLRVSKQIKITPFITTFILEKNGMAY